MTGRRKMPDPSLNHIFNALSIGIQYTFSFQWTNFGLKCLLLPLENFRLLLLINDLFYKKHVNYNSNADPSNFLAANL